MRTRQLYRAVLKKYRNIEIIINRISGENRKQRKSWRKKIKLTNKFLFFFTVFSYDTHLMVRHVTRYSLTIKKMMYKTYFKIILLNRLLTDPDPIFENNSDLHTSSDLRYDLVFSTSDLNLKLSSLVLVLTAVLTPVLTVRS